MQKTETKLRTKEWLEKMMEMIDFRGFEEEKDETKKEDKDSE